MTRRYAFYLLVLTMLCVVAGSAVAQSSQPSQAPRYSNPLIAADFPDPSIIRTGNDYWATATTGGWEPEFPIMHSRDLVNWELAGSVFSQRPAWAKSDFWAPEISEYKGHYFVFYTARNFSGLLCVASASADAPQGPYTDHGSLVCQPDGSIDAFPTTDENGDRYLIWKEDGNSRDLPTPLWAQKLSADGTKLLGDKVEILRNDVAWEGRVVEGPFILRHAGYFYLFYSGSACCGLQCDYAVGVARSTKLLGPWEKYSANPIIRGNSVWECPGHGSIVSDQRNRDFFLFHSYRHGQFHAGRQAVLEQISWGTDGWPSVNDTKGVSTEAVSPSGAVQKPVRFRDGFKGPLQPGWQWAIGHKPEFRTGATGLTLSAPNGAATNELYMRTVLTRQPFTFDYVASTVVATKSLPQGGSAGLVAYGGTRRASGVSVSRGKVELWEKRDSATRVVRSVSRDWKLVHIRVTAQSGTQFRFEISADGKAWEELGAATDDLFLPPWEGDVRLALCVGGKGTAASGEFRKFEVAASQPGRAEQH